ncbi:MAG TPA: hypothetical protein VLI40_13605, partial [Gemmatimonadaceae bacterium]|nr:hypothetical protein [Gemmatimonadaceae bacterium]
NGFSSSNSWFPDQQLSVTILTNSGAAKAGALMAQVSRAALGVPLLQPHRRVAIPPAMLAHYAGVYALKLGDTVRDFTFFVRNDTLYAQLAGQGANALIPYGDNKFGASFDPDAIVTFVIVNGKATKVILDQNGRTSQGLRKQ